jgi:hypothetical protein
MTTISETGYMLYDLVTAAGFNDKYARFIVSQAAHESANFTSMVFQENNNPFGIKYFRQKEATGEKNGYAYYENGMGQSVTDYKRIFKTFGLVSLTRLDQFVNVLKIHNYFEAPEEEYLKGCTWFYNLYFPEGWSKQPVSGAGGSW